MDAENVIESEKVTEDEGTEAHEPFARMFALAYLEHGPERQERLFGSQIKPMEGPVAQAKLREQQGELSAGDKLIIETYEGAQRRIEEMKERFAMIEEDVASLGPATKALFDVAVTWGADRLRKVSIAVEYADGQDFRRMFNLNDDDCKDLPEKPEDCDEQLAFWEESGFKASYLKVRAQMEERMPLLMRTARELCEQQLFSLPAAALDSEPGWQTYERRFWAQVELIETQPPMLFDETGADVPDEVADEQLDVAVAFERLKWKVRASRLGLTEQFVRFSKDGAHARALLRLAEAYTTAGGERPTTIIYA